MSADNIELLEYENSSLFPVLILEPNMTKVLWVQRCKIANAIVAKERILGDSLYICIAFCLSIVCEIDLWFTCFCF